MKKTVVIAVAIGVLTGALVGGFLWMRSEGGASLESVDKAGSADSKPEHSEGSRQNESTPSQESDKGVNLNLDTRRFDMTGDIGDFHTAFRETLAAAGRVKEGELKLSELYALIDGYEFNSDWKMYLRIGAMKQLGLPISRLEKRFHSRGGDFLTNLLRDRSNAESAAVVKPQLKPIGDTWNWAKEHAPSEYETVYKRYHRLIRRDAFFGVPLSVERYLLPEERVSRLYNLFFEALTELPADAKMFTEYFDGVLSASPPPIASSPAASDDFEATAMESIERYGVHEGLRRLAESHPWWESRVAQWAQERQKRLTPSQGNESE